MQAPPVIQNPAYIPDEVVRQYEGMLASGMRPVMTVPFPGRDGREYSIAALDMALRARYGTFAGPPSVPRTGGQAFVNALGTVGYMHGGGASSGGVPFPLPPAAASAPGLAVALQQPSGGTAQAGGASGNEGIGRDVAKLHRGMKIVDLKNLYKKYGVKGASTISG
jgi:hypothetical protein